MMIFQISNDRRTWIAAFLVMVCITGLALGGMVTHGLNAGGDDQETLQDMRGILDQPTHFWSSERLTPIRPTFDLVFLTGYVLWGDRAAGYHGLQIILHLVAAILLIVVSVRLGADLELSLLAGMLFLVHVAHFRSVQWVMSINNILSLIFGLLTVFFFVRYLKSGQARNLLAVVLCLVAAVFAHPAAVSVALFCAYLVWMQAEGRTDRFRLAALLVLVAVISGALMYLVSPHLNQAQGLMTMPDIRRVLGNPLWYLSRLVVSGFWLTAAGIRNEPQIWEYALGLLLCAGIFALVYRRIFPVAHWGMWCLCAVLPFANNPLDRLIVGPSRHLYLASAGSAFLAAWVVRTVICQFVSSASVRRVIFLGCALGLMVLGTVAQRRAEAIDYWFLGRSAVAYGDHKDGFSQFQNAILQSPEWVPSDAFVRVTASAFFSDESPLSLLKDAEQYRPDAEELQMLIGVSELMHDPSRIADVDRVASDAFSRARNPDQFRVNTALVLYALGVHFQRVHKSEDAAAMFTRAIQWRSGYTKAYTGLGNVLFDMGRTEDAVRVFQKLLALAPRDIEGLEGLGTVLYNSGQRSEALEVYRKLAAYDPQNVLAHYRIALIHNALDQKPEELQGYAKTVALDPDHKDAWERMGNLLYQFGRLEEALAAFREVVRLAPDYDVGLRKLAAVQARLNALRKMPP